MADIAVPVLAKLRNKAKASGISYQQCLQLFVQEEFLRKLSKSGCEDTLILKGCLLYTSTSASGAFFLFLILTVRPRVCPPER